MIWMQRYTNIPTKEYSENFLCLQSSSNASCTRNSVDVKHNKELFYTYLALVYNVCIL